MATDYERGRPPYPGEVFDELYKLARLSPGARVLEIGCGTGQATVPLAERGLDIVAVELGSRLAARARQRLATFDRVEVVNASFEDWSGGGTTFDAATSFAALHWVDPEVRFAKTARLLRPGAALAVFDWTDSLSEAGDGFFREVVADYDAVVPEWGMTAPPPSGGPDSLLGEMTASTRFGRIVERRFVWSCTYDANGYIAFLNTRSTYRELDERRRSELFDRIRRRIERRALRTVCPEFAGTSTVGYV